MPIKVPESAVGGFGIIGGVKRVDLPSNRVDLLEAISSMDLRGFVGEKS